MTKGKASGQAPEGAKPSPAMKRLERLVGTWHIKGRTPESNGNNILGRMTCEWMSGGFFLMQRGEIQFDGSTIESLEIIGYDPASDTFRASVYTNMTGAVLAYGWNVQVDTVTHWTEGNKYTGTFSKDGRTLSGGWRPEEGKQGITYDAIMTRVD